ncbi:MAG: hypothetical protein ACK4S4_10430 [Pyrinomonadaceae bacterium]
MKRSAVLVLLGTSVLIAACGGHPAMNTNANVAVGPLENVNADQLPAGITVEPIQPSANSTPGIPPVEAVNVANKGATPTPGIPDPKTIGKPLKPGATPTPGIPDPETLRKMMNGQSTPDPTLPPQGNIEMRSMRKGENQMRPNRPKATPTP